MYDEYEDMAWQRFREDSLRMTRQIEEAAIKKWLKEIGYKEPVGYYRNILDREMVIYTKRPGCLIGRAGTDVEKFRKILTEEFGGEWKVKFVEVRGGFVGI